MTSKNAIRCPVHGDTQPAYVCSHLLGDAVGLGFNRNDPLPDNPFPDAWCDNCELIRAQGGGWTKSTEKLAETSLLCARCYERSRIRNTRTEISLHDLADLRWKCSSCDELHSGPCLDFGYDSPAYWDEGNQSCDSFLNEDVCVLEKEDFFVRGLINLPIIGTAETFSWGVWGSLSRENFEKLMEVDESPKRTELPPMFSWLSNQIPEYPDTLNLKMYVHVQEIGLRPLFELEPTDHPLSREYHDGITPERVKQIMLGRVGNAGDR